MTFYDVENYAEIYNEMNISFSRDLAQNLSNYLVSQGVRVTSLLDYACGTGVFCELMNKKWKLKNCVGLDLSKKMLKLAKDNSKTQIKYIYGDMTEYSFADKFDLVTCNYDAVNHLEQFEDWKKFFKKAFTHLNKGGYFVFDYNTNHKLERFKNSFWFTERPKFDFVSNIHAEGNKLCFQEYVYLKTQDGTYKKYKTKELKEACFDDDKIVDALTKVGFSEIKLCDKEYAPIDPSAVGRVFVICKK